jgi:DNA polymerase I
MAKIFDTGTLTKTTQLTQDETDWIYNGLDCCVTLEIAETLLSQLDPVAEKTYNFSKALQAPILEMSMRGILIDENRRQSVLSLYTSQMARVEEQLNQIIKGGIGCEINWRSPAQLKKLLYDVMGLPPVRKRNAQGFMAPTANREALEKLAHYFIAEPICSHMLFLRDLEKKRQFLVTAIDPDQRIRSNFNIAGTNTGRLASSMSDFGTGGNLQNIDRDLRSVFIADKGMKFANLDLEQADSRNLGALCWTNFYESHGATWAGKYLDACESGDLHTTVCRMARPNLPWTDDPKANRAIADQVAYRNMSYRDLDKRLGHGSNYLGQPATMARHTKAPVKEITTFQENYFRNFACIPAYHEYVKFQLENYAQLTTLFGRRRFFFSRPSDPATLREAVAYSPQSMTADEIDTGILNLWRANRVQLLVQVHDSILFQYPEELENEIVPWALETLKAPLDLIGGRRFVVPTEAKVGWNWGERHDNNPDGLIKWKGSDSRKRVDQPTINKKFSLKDY